MGRVEASTNLTPVTDDTKYIYTTALDGNEVLDSVSSKVSKTKSGLILSNGAIWYVDAAMGSSGDGKTPTTAFKTIQEAHDAASSGDIISIQSGEYNENVNATGLTVSKDRLTFIAKEPFQVVVANTNVGASCTIYVTSDYCAFYNILTSGDLTTASDCNYGWQIESSADRNLFYKCGAAGHSTYGFTVWGSVNILDTCLGVFNGLVGTPADFEILGGSFHQLKNCNSIGFDLGSLAGTGFRINSGSASYNIIKNCSTVTRAYGFYIFATYALVTNCSAGGCTDNVYVDPTSYHSVLVDFNEDSYITAYNSLQQDLKAVYDNGNLTSTSNSVVALSDTTEVTLKEWASNTDTFIVENFYIDFSAWCTTITGQTATIRVYTKVDDTNYKVIDDIVVSSESVNGAIAFNSFAVKQDTKITMQPSGNTTDNVVISYVTRGV